ncbi:FAS1-like dehydratase domain-containing protein [Mycobacterium kansasii]|uniref:FAS1-like dehydratase domain-containing protein n=1 Tax=Mycobacterium kansasii TaxID=1768 RepID=UPI001FE3A019|nr:MaoC family dehydratase N-terminal domain-containing protein [Mycobacterium kansasii]
MPIDVDSVLGAELAERQGSWSATDVILYHLGLGAGVPHTDPAELAYTFEGQLKVLPSFGVIPASPMLFDMLKLPGMDVDLSKLLHGEQEMELYGPLPVNGVVGTSARIRNIVDKGKAALVVLETVTRDAAATCLWWSTSSARSFEARAGSATATATATAPVPHHRFRLHRHGSRTWRSTAAPCPNRRCCIASPVT